MGGLSFAQDADGKWGYKVGADAVIPFKKGIVSFIMYRGFYTGSSLKAFGIDVTDFKKITYYGSNGFKFNILNSNLQEIASYTAISAKRYADITSLQGIYYFAPNDNTSQYTSCTVELE